MGRAAPGLGGVGVQDPMGGTGAGPTMGTTSMASGWGRWHEAGDIGAGSVTGSTM
jgi:hypothetical protein